MPADALAAQVEPLFAQGLQYHGQGQLDQAMAAYEQVLQLAPAHFGALYHVGIAAFQVGNFEMAAGFFRSALAVDGDDAAAHSNLGNALKELGRPDEALSSYARALAINGADADTHYNLAGTLQALGRHAEALHGYDQALALNGADEQAWHHRAVVLRQLKRHAPALQSAEQALALNPHNADAHDNRGELLLALGRGDEAEHSYRRALELAPGNAEAHFHLGRLFLLRERYQEALAGYQNALGLKPRPATVIELRAGLISIYGKLGRQQLERNKPAEAAQLFEALLKIDDGDVDIWQLQALALHEAGHHDAALLSIDHAITLRPDNGRYHLARGVMLHAMQRYDEAQVCFEKAVKLAPRLADAYAALGRLQARSGHFDRALKNYQQAIALDPQCALAQWNQAQIYLRRGDFKLGWRAYEWRWKNPSLPMYKSRRDFPQPAWTGREALEGKTILLHAEQGLGDTLQFCRYAALVAQRGASVVLEVQAPLAGLMASLQGVTRVVSKGEVLPPFDYHIPLMSLPLAFGTRLDTVPAMVPYLASAPARVAQWQALLGPRRGLRVGLVWRGASTHLNDQGRSMPLSALAPLLSAPWAERCEFVSLQKEVRPDEQLLLDALPVRQVADQLRDFSDTAALCDLMDVVIAVDTSVAHLAGALGKPVWLLLQTPGEWRWLERRRDSPWYPGASLYRQARDGDWHSVTGAVAADLQALAARALPLD